MIALAHRAQRLLDATRAVDFPAPLALRIYLAPVFWMAGSNKLAAFDSTVEWFGKERFTNGHGDQRHPRPGKALLAMAVFLTPALSQGEGEMERAARDFHRNTFNKPIKSYL